MDFCCGIATADAFVERCYECLVFISLVANVIGLNHGKEWLGFDEEV